MRHESDKHRPLVAASIGMIMTVGMVSIFLAGNTPGSVVASPQNNSNGDLAERATESMLEGDLVLNSDATTDETARITAKGDSTLDGGISTNIVEKTTETTFEKELAASDSTSKDATKPSNQGWLGSGKSFLYDVVDVVDGDTIKINYGGTITKVRLIGVNTPETVDPRKTVECYGVEASNFLKELLEGQKVEIESDFSQADRDKYNRLLRYVYLNGDDINLRIIAEGYGYEYTYSIPYAKQSEYKAAQDVAAAEGRGLWAPTTCNGGNLR